MKAGAIAVAALAAAAALPSLRNGFVYDDLLVIVQNPLVHDLSRFADLWQSSYWPAGLLYRPVAIQLFALEWAAGGGRPFLFHAVSVLLAMATALLVFRVARRLVPPWAALAAAALFALHPVHIEAVSNIVGQSELLAALFALLAVERYLVWRVRGELSLASRAGLAGLTLLAILSKETGYVIPLLLAAAEFTVIRRPRERWGGVFVLQACAVAAGLLVRVGVLGTIKGESGAVVFQGLDLPGRAVAMLAVVPEWARLLLWPAHLQAEYGPPAIPVTGGFGAAHALGLLLVLLTVAAVVWAWQRRPVVAFGLLWVGLALAPVSNLAAATGIVLAERVLFLPSVGLVLVLAGLLPEFSPVSRPSRVALAAVLVLLALAGVRSVTRHAAWRSQEEFFAALLRDAPRTYRAHFVAARYYYGERRFPESEGAARQALALYPRDVRVHEQLGQALRVQARCAEAIPVLADGVRLDPTATTARSRLIECALAVGDSARARAAAREAVALGQTEFGATLERLAP